VAGENLMMGSFTNLYSSQNRMMKSQMIVWTGPVECMGPKSVRTNFSYEKSKERNYLEDPGEVWRIILKFLLKNRMGKYRLD
jgi:hypothetical protein